MTKLEFARLQWEAQEADGRVFMAWGRNCRGEPVKLCYVNRSVEEMEPKGLSGHSEWVTPNRAFDFKK